MHERKGYCNKYENRNYRVYQSFQNVRNLFWQAKSTPLILQQPDFRRHRTAATGRPSSHWQLTASAVLVLRNDFLQNRGRRLLRPFSGILKKSRRAGFNAEEGAETAPDFLQSCFRLSFTQQQMPCAVRLDYFSIPESL
jgi:hypothetical protein